MCPANGQPIAKVVTGTVADYDRCVTKCQEAWQTWAEVTPPHRGEIVRQVPLHKYFLCVYRYFPAGWRGAAAVPGAAGQAGVAGDG